MHADNQVTGVQLVTTREDKEIITRGFATILRIMFGAREKRSEMLIGNDVTNDNDGGGPHVAIDNGERRLVAVVLMQECGCGFHTSS